MINSRPLKVFLCHASGDKPIVRELYQKLAGEGWIDPWLDEENLFPGQDWDIEIEKAVEAADVVIVCLSQNSVNKEGYVQRELRYALDIALTKPEETIFIIPLRLENCAPPRRLRAYHYADYFPVEQRERAYQRLLYSLQMRALALGIQAERLQLKPVPVKPDAKPKVESKREPIIGRQSKDAPSIAIPKSILKIGLNKANWGGIEFVKVPAGPFLMGSIKGDSLTFDDEYSQHTVNISYDYWMARFPLTNDQYAGYTHGKRNRHPVSEWGMKKDHPVTNVSWADAVAYCEWLNDLLKDRLPSGLILRLPTETEWEKAARGESANVWSWGNEFDETKCNSAEGGKGATTPVGLYSPLGDSPYGCADMIGNVWEWTHSLYKPYPYKSDDDREGENALGLRVLRGGSWINDRNFARCAFRRNDLPDTRFDYIGFRVCASPISFNSEL